ncbi:MAG: flagellar hook protein FlgE [Bdellovibrionaceae bacterium]|nr:flagellar hook protein FlgE [Pseudobdellovibrionaceae bacterium]
MGIVSSMHTAVSGLTSNGQALGVTADNIANASTNGFKTSRAEFQDMMSRSISGSYGGMQVGRGSKVASITPLLAQGNVDNTGRDTDLAINGNGFFIVDGSTGRSFTRNGEFHFDKDGYFVTSDQFKLKGFEFNETGEATQKLVDIQLPRSLVPARTTKLVRLDMNLDSRIPAGAEKTINLDDPYKSADFTTGVEVHDSQGTKHLVTLAFVKKAEGTWEWKALGKASEVAGADPAKGYAEMASGELTFTPDGKLNSEKTNQKNFSFVGAIPNQDINFNFGDAIAAGGTGLKGLRQFGHVSDLMSWSQDGAATGSLTGISFSDDGVLTALYSNGQAEDLAQVALARFENPEGLVKTGNNKMKECRESGGAAIGFPSHGGRGQILAGALERSTVDLAGEFVDMIKTQRNFQANAKTITTSDEMLSDVINIRR